jgi:hypothetical protein
MLPPNPGEGDGSDPFQDGCSGYDSLREGKGLREEDGDNKPLQCPLS